MMVGGSFGEGPCWVEEGGMGEEPMRGRERQSLHLPQPILYFQTGQPYTHHSPLLHTSSFAPSPSSFSIPESGRSRAWLVRQPHLACCMRYKELLNRPWHVCPENPEIRLISPSKKQDVQSIKCSQASVIFQNSFNLNSTCSSSLGTATIARFCLVEDAKKFQRAIPYIPSEANAKCQTKLQF